MTMDCSRRGFVATTSLAAGAALLRTRGLIAHPLPASVLSSGVAPQVLIPEGLAPSDLRMLATTAVDAATHAGAAFADIRVGEQHVLDILAVGATDPVVRIQSTITYGIRVLVDG